MFSRIGRAALRPAIIGWLAACATLVPRAPLAAEAGQDIEVVHLTDAEGTASEPKLLFTSDGTAFVALKYRHASGGDELRVFRSASGGTVWSEWGAPRPVMNKGTFDACILPGTPDRVALCYASDSPDPIQYLWLVTAAADQTSPTWQSSIIQTTYYPIQMASPSLSATEGSPWESARVACVWQADSTGYTDIRSLNYAGSTNGGATWTTDLGIALFDDYAPMAHDVAIDELYRLHVALSLNEEVIFLRAAYDFGYGYVQTSSWQISTPATTVEVVASPTTDAVFVSATDGGAHQARLYRSVDEEEPILDQLFSDVETPALTCDQGGPKFCAVAPSGNGSQRYAVFRREEGIGWVNDQMLAGLDAIPGGGAIASDPVHPEELGVVGLMPNLGGDGTSPWFDADWRGGPGYGSPEFEPGIDVGGGVITSSLAVADLDDDGDSEVIFTANGPDRVKRFDLESMTTTTLQNVGPTSAASAPAVIDINGDRTLEVFVGTDDGRLHGLRENGSLVPGFPIDLGSGEQTWVSCARVTEAENGEVVAASARSVWLYGSSGQLRAGFPYVASTGRGRIVGRVAIGDLDEDGEVELVAAYQNALLILSDHGTLVRQLLTSGPPLSGGASLADLDADGDLEIAVPHANGTVSLIHHGGSTYGASWPRDTFTNQPVGSIAIADFFPGSTRELAFAAGSTVFASHLTTVTSVYGVGALAPRTEPIIAGLDAVGPEIAVGDTLGTGYVIPTAGSQIGWPRGFHAAIDHASAAGDLDHDGTTELVVPAGPRLWVLDMRVPQAESIWPMAGGRASRSGCRECDPEAPVAAVGDPAPGASIELSIARPNPFDSSTTIHYRLPAGGGAVRLELFDIAGRRVRTLVNEGRSAGDHVVSWDGTDAFGRPVAAGIYLVRSSGSGAATAGTVVYLGRGAR
ncbi:MAG: hypothetical protein IT349_21825 [Candidatus Eisenbacteria bacterium]|nr:hypothetical protein [Candidatus Eisenbacteria bacterium]